VTDEDVRERLSRLENEVASLRQEVRRAGAGGSRSALRTVLLWFVLILLFFSFYSMFSRQRPSPGPENAPSAPR
jgi:HAMP domain-containing protein